jgi:hypothetical protein
MPSVIFVSQAGHGQTQQLATSRMGAFIPGPPSQRKLQVTSGTKSETTRNETAAGGVFFTIKPGGRGVD